jgi:beta-lactamase regulating signal transducer with metallopeptidase domain
MNPLGFLRDILSQFSTAPGWTQLLAKATLLLAVAWVVHFSLARANPRWRTLLWRGVAVGLLLMVVWVPYLPGLAIRVPAPEPVATQGVATKSAAIEPVMTKAPSLDPRFATEREPTGHLRAVKGPHGVPAAVTRSTTRHAPVAAHPEAAGPVRPLAPPLSWPVTLLGVWALGVALLVFRLAVGCAGLKRLLRTSQVVSDELVAEVGRIATALGCRHAVQVRNSRRIAVPFMCGLRRPVLVLPERMCLPDYRRQLPGVIAHELAHVVSSDFAWNAAMQASAILLWFHPLAWRIGSAHRAACDAVCDAVAASHLGDAAAYCRTLAQVALQGAASFPALGLAMARTCDVRRRIAAIQRRVSAAALGRRAVFGVILAGLLASALLAGVRVAVAELPAQTTEGQSATSSAKVAGNNQPVKPEKLRTISMSAEAFGRLSVAEQRALLVRVFQRRLEQSHNLYYEVDESTKFYEGRNGERGNLRTHEREIRRRWRHWRLEDSFRVDQDTYKDPGDAEPSSSSSYGLNAAEGVFRNTDNDRNSNTPPHGQIQYPHPDDCSDRYIYWFDRKDPRPDPILGEYLFPYLIRHQDQFDIKSPIADGKVQLTVPWQPGWTTKPGGKREYILDPEKGFLPVRCDSRWDEAAEAGGKPHWRIEKLAVEESRLVGDVWMPTRLTDETAASPVPDLVDISEMKVSRIEFGAVKPADLFVPFTSGMQIRDTIEGVTYVTDAQGNAVAPKFEPYEWTHDPPQGSSKRAAAAGGVNALSMASRFSPADRKRLDAEKKAFEDKNDLQKTAFATALKVMRSSAPLDERIEAGLKVLRTYPTSIDNDFKPWASVIRELIEIGKPAVPKLTAELDRTEKDKMLRDLGFVLRGIGDPHAAPALIRAIPRMANPSGSDDGFSIDGDPKLGQFMREHDSQNRGRPGQSAAGSVGFFYGRPIYEIMPALEKLVGGIGGWREFRFVFVETGSARVRFQRRLFLELAERWADWWSKNWPKYVKNKEEAQLDQTAKVLEVYSRSLSAALRQPGRSGFPCGPSVVLEGGSQDGWTPSFDEHPADAFRDLDTGRLPNPPPDLVKTSSGHEPSKQLLAWAEGEGVNLVTVKIKASDGKWYYAFRPLGMKVWRIENSRFANLEKELHESRQLLLPAPWQGLLAPIDEKTGLYDDKLTASFLFITKEGTCGALQIVPPLSGEFGANGYSSAGLHCTFIYEKDTER